MNRLPGSAGSTDVDETQMALCGHVWPDEVGDDVDCELCHLNWAEWVLGEWSTC